MKRLASLGMFFICAFTTSAQSTDRILSAEKIIELIPDKIQGFTLNGESQSKVIRMGTLQYSMAEKNFTAPRKQSVKILLFDYKEAPIMFNQATRKFKTFTPVESDSLILRSVYMNDCTGWESYNIHRKNSQILLGVCNRFFLTVEGTNVDLETLKRVVQGFKIENFPK
jgi:hypothetical protein